MNKIKVSGVKEVIFAMYDPNPLNNGKGALFLRRQGIEVLSGILKEEAERLNEVFIKYITRQLPFVTVKIAQSLEEVPPPTLEELRLLRVFDPHRYYLQ